MFKRPLTLALVALTVPLFGGIAYAATQSVSSEPSPKVVIPTTPTTDDHGSVRSSTGGTDDPANHDANGVPAAHGAPVTTVKTGDDPATHDVGDDKGGLTPAASKRDDPATHDVGDDKGGLAPAASAKDDPATHDAPATHDVGDNHGGR
jgi:hypothetical protein